MTTPYQQRLDELGLTSDVIQGFLGLASTTLIDPKVNEALQHMVEAIREHAQGANGISAISMMLAAAAQAAVTSDPDNRFGAELICHRIVEHVFQSVEELPTPQVH